MKKNKVCIMLNITDFDCSPSKITEILGVEPTEVALKGEPIPSKVPRRGIRKYKYSSWSWKASNESSLVEQIDEVVKKFLPICEKFKNIPVESYFELSCWLDINDELIPMVRFNKDAIKFMSIIKAEFDLDMYFWRDVPKAKLIKKHNTMIGLQISNFEVEPEEITKILGLAPTRTWINTGGYEAVLSTMQDKNAWVWEVSSKTKATSGKQLDQKINEVIGHLLPVCERSQYLPVDSKISLLCYLDAQNTKNDSIPSIHIDHPAFDFLNKVGGELEIDLYCDGKK